MRQKHNQIFEKKASRVKFYSGYKNRQIPRSIVTGGKEHIITNIKEQKRILNSKTGEIFNQFVCQADKKTFIIKVPENQVKDKEVIYEKKNH
jgi:hypothetical protein